MIKYLQVFMCVWLLSLLSLGLLQFILQKKINKANRPYSKDEIEDTFLKEKKKYQFESNLVFIGNKVPSYNFMTKTIAFSDKKQLFKSDYIAFSHEVAHAIHHHLYPNNLVYKFKIGTTLGSILFCIFGGLLFLISENFINPIANIIFILGLVLGVLNVIAISRMEADANVILLSDSRCSEYRLYIKSMEFLQVGERLFFVLILSILFLKYRLNFF